MVNSANYGRTIEELKRADKLFNTSARLHFDVASPFLLRA